MSLMITAMRRSIWLLLVGAVGGAVWAWWREQNAPPSPSSPPEWPPLTTTTETRSTPGADATTPSAASIVNALVDTPDARSDAESGHWVPANDDGSCPPEHPIKANDNSGIFHVPGGRFYDRTRAERCYATAEAAIADGYRQAKA
jgi:hypothetical protein